MSQEDYSVANASGATVRADINAQLGAIATMNSGATEPATQFANMGWFDTANNLMKVRKEDNSGWITIAEKDATNWKPYHGTVALLAATMAWTANHDFGAQVLWTGVISPSQITANQNNYNPASLSGALQLRVNTDASRNVTGLAGGADGRLLLVTNIGSFNLVLVNQSASSTAGNRFLFAGGDRTLTPNESVLMRYDGTTARWRAAHDVVVSTGATIVSKTADETVNNSTTLQNDDHLLFAMAANKTYVVKATLLLSAASGTPDFKFGWTVPASCVMFWGTTGHTGWNNEASALIGEGGTLTPASVTGTTGVQFAAIVRNGGNAGNLQLQWAQNVADASDSKVLKHSYLTYLEIGAT